MGKKLPEVSLPFVIILLISSMSKFPTRTQPKPQKKSSHHSRQTAPLIPRTSMELDHMSAAPKLASAKCRARAHQLTNSSSAKKIPRSTDYVWSPKSAKSVKCLPDIKPE